MMQREKKDGVHSSSFGYFPRWDFDVMDVEPKSLPKLVEGVFTLTSLDAVNNLMTSKECVSRFVQAISQLYKNNPFHNLIHAVDVLHAMHIFVTQSEAKNWFTPVEKIAMVIAAFVHDVDHPGFTNSFLVATGHYLALRYNDESVLEHHHAATAFSVLQSSECNILAGLDKAEQRRVRTMIVSMVLATDMSKHAETMELLRARMHQGPLRPDSAADRLLMAKMLIKMADAAMVVRPFKCYKAWAALIIVEYLNQGDKEKAMGLPVSPVMDRDTLDFPSAAANYINDIVLPMYQAMVDLLPSIKGNMETVLENRRHWYENCRALRNELQPSPELEGDAHSLQKASNAVDNSVRLAADEARDTAPAGMVPADMAADEDEAQPTAPTRKTKWARRASILARDLLVARGTGLEDLPELATQEPSEKFKTIQFANGECMQVEPVTSTHFDTLLRHGSVNNLQVPELTPQNSFQPSTAGKGLFLSDSLSSQHKALLPPEPGKRFSFQRVQERVDGMLRINKLMHSRGYQTVISLATLVALFQRDVVVASFDKDADLFRYVMGMVIVVIYMVNLVMCAAVQPNYLGSLRALVDALSTASLLSELLLEPDYSWRRGSIGRLLRVCALVRMTSFLRLLIHHAPVAGKNLFRELMKGMQEKPSSLWAMVSELMMIRLILGMTVGLLGAALLSEGEVDNGPLSWLGVFEDLPIYSNEFNSTLFKMHLYHERHDYHMLFFAVKEPCVLQRKKTDSLEDYIKRREDECDYSEQAASKPFHIVLGPYGSLYTEEAARDKLRGIELLTMESSTGQARAVFDVRHKVQLQAYFNIGLTSFLGLLFIVWFGSIGRDARTFLIDPITAIMDMIEELSRDPVGFAAKVPVVNALDNMSDARQVEAAFIKVAKITKVALGEAGLRILSENLHPGGRQLNLMLPGKVVEACFGFCDIRSFTDATEVLREGVLVFVNTIAQLVHKCVLEHQGAPNKNIGDAFLMVWKKAESAHAVLDVHEFSDFEPHGSFADNALAAVLSLLDELDNSKILKRLVQDPRLQERLPNYKVRMGFGLHVGWGIEGAIGSVHKIDPSYLSPHVNLASRLESATKFYGVHVLISSAVLSKLLLPHHIRGTRLLDKITVKGSAKPIELFTFDRESDAESCTVSLPEYKEKYEKAVRLYLDGNWPEAISHLQQCRRDWPDDQPAKNLIAYMQHTGGVAPGQWKGYREMTEK